MYSQSLWFSCLLFFQPVYCSLYLPFDSLDTCTCDWLWSWETTRTPWVAQENTSHAVTRPRMVAELVVAFTDPGSFLALWSSKRRFFWMEEFVKWLNIRRTSWCVEKWWSMKQERHELQFAYMHRKTEEDWLASGLETSRRRLRLMKSSVWNSQMWKRIRWKKCPCLKWAILKKKRVKQLAFMLMEHTKNRAIQMITKLGDPVNGLEIWRRFLEEWEPVNRGRYRAMLMQFLQCLLAESRGQALEGVGTSCTAVRGAEFGHNQRSNTGTQPTGFRMVQIRQTQRDKTAEAWCSQKCVQREKQRQRQEQAQRQKASTKAKRKARAKAKRKDKARISRRKEHQTRRTPKCSSCKRRNRPKSLRWPAEKKTISHELSKLTMIDSDASIHVCPLNNGQGDGFRKSSETRPLPGAEVQQCGMRQISCDSDAGRVTAVHRALDMRRSIWSLRSINGFWYTMCTSRTTEVGLPKITGKNLTWFSAVECSSWQPNLQNCCREIKTRWNSIWCHTQRSNVQCHAGFGIPWPCNKRHLGRRWTVGAYQNSHKPGDTLSWSTMLRDARPVTDGVECVPQCEQWMNRIWWNNSQKPTEFCFSQCVWWWIKKLNNNIVFHESIQWVFVKNNRDIRGSSGTQCDGGALRPRTGVG